MNKKRANDNSTAWIHIRLTPKEKHMIEAAAHILGLSVSEFVRQAAMAAAAKVLIQTIDLDPDLRRDE